MKINSIDNNNEFDFGRTSEGYAKYRDIYPASMYEKLIACGIGKEGQEILDLGSGTAVLPINMHRIGAHFTATDISENQIAHAKKLAAEKGMTDIRFKVCPAEDTGFDDSSFDAVTAVQCFPYFDAEKASKEIHRVLKPQGMFCMILMDWLPAEDAIIAEMIDTVKRYNPAWNENGFQTTDHRFPKWAEGRFEIADVHSCSVDLVFTRDAWLGRVKTCRGVGASLPPEKIVEFENEYRAILQKYNEPLRLKHQIHMELYRSLKENIMDIWNTLYEKAKEQYHPEEVSPFIYAHHVVCALEAENGEIYTGFCIEGCSGVMNLCAERVAALNMYANSGQTAVKRLIAFRAAPPSGGGSGMPCGACREFFLQLDQRNADMEIMVDYETRETVALKELMPNWWGWERYED